MCVDGREFYLQHGDRLTGLHNFKGMLEGWSFGEKAGRMYYILEPSLRYTNRFVCVCVCVQCLQKVRRSSDPAAVQSSDDVFMSMPQFFSSF